MAAVVAFLVTASAAADVDVGKLVENWRIEAASLAPASEDPFFVLSRRGDGLMRLIVRQRGVSNVEAPLPGMMRIHAGVFAWSATAEEVSTLIDARPDLRVTWSAPRHVMLDQAIPLTRADVVHRDYGLTGRGVVVGIVDTGLDIRHADLRNANGTSRIAWLLDMSHAPLGRHAELEDAFHCSDAKTPCAVYSGADLDEIIAKPVTSDEPRDSYGHGTHVASLAAGNGLASPTPKYVGMAPGATIVAVRATRDATGIVEDPDILSAVEFIFQVADEQLAAPAVANLSLGGDFGAHDGTSALERELAKFVGPDHPGHSIVVAAGNSGSLYHSNTLPYPNPLGIHATAQVPSESSVRVPILIAGSVEPALPSQLYVWIASRPGDRLKVGLDTENGSWIAPLDVNQSKTKKDPSGKYLAQIQNGVTESDDPESIDHAGAVIAISGPFEDTRAFALRLEGHGTASIWVQPAGGIDPSLNDIGAIIPNAQREGTISIPGTSTELIAVGATLDRVDWKDVSGTNEIASSYITNYLRQSEVLPFSAAGPTAVDELKPDLVAPGGLVAGAMSSLTDPRTQVGAAAMFKGSKSECHTSSDDCLVVDDQHALSTGTSMASPIVAGAIALLLERDMTLTQQQIIGVLQAGASTVGDYYSSPSQVGAGMLDVENALLALDGQASDAAVNLTNSWIGLANSYVRPDPLWPVAGLVHLRDASNHAVDIAVERLSLRISNGRVLSDLTRRAPGYYRFQIAGVERSAGQQCSVALVLDGRPLLEVQRDIAVDAPNSDLVPLAGRGCALAPPACPVGSAAACLLLLSSAAVWRRRRTAQRGVAVV